MTNLPQIVTKSPQIATNFLTSTKSAESIASLIRPAVIDVILLRVLGEKLIPLRARYVIPVGPRSRHTKITYFRNEFGSGDREIYIYIYIISEIFLHQFFGMCGELLFCYYSMNQRQ